MTSTKIFTTIKNLPESLDDGKNSILEILIDGELISQQGNPYKCGSYASKIESILFAKAFNGEKISKETRNKLSELRNKLWLKEIELLAPDRKKLAEIIASRDDIPALVEFDKAFPTEHFWHNAYMKKAWDNLFITELKVWEIITKEFIGSWANYLLPRIIKLNSDGIKPVKFLEVGAGDGKLSKFLEIALKVKGADVEFLAVDDASWQKEGRAQFGNNVEKIDYQQALNSYSPDIVISSWMPFTQDFTANFRKTKSVKGYILLGALNETGTVDAWGVDIKSAVEKYGDILPDGADMDRHRFRERIQRVLSNKSEALKSVDDFEIVIPPENLTNLQCSAERDVDGPYVTGMREFWRGEVV